MPTYVLNYNIPTLLFFLYSFFIQVLFVSSSLYILFTVCLLDFINYQLDHSSVSFLVIIDPKRLSLLFSYTIMIPHIGQCYLYWVCFIFRVQSVDFRISSRNYSCTSFKIISVMYTIVPCESRDSEPLDTPTVAPIPAPTTRPL